LFLIPSLIFYSGDEDENPPIDVTARTSTSRTLVISEAQPDADETSPPQQNIEHPTPVASPRASSPKRARVEPVEEPTLLIGGSTTPSMDDVSPFLYVATFSAFFGSPLTFVFAVELVLPMLISLSLFSLSAFDEGIYPSRYPIHRIP
jgi:hypothetical protein